MEPKRKDIHRHGYLLSIAAPLLVLIIGILGFEMISDCSLEAKDEFLKIFGNKESESDAVSVFGAERRARYTLMIVSLFMYLASGVLIFQSIDYIFKNTSKHAGRLIVAATIIGVMLILGMIFTLPFVEPFCGGKLIYQFPRAALGTSATLRRLLGPYSSQPSWPGVAGWINIFAVGLGILAAKLGVVATATILTGWRVERDHGFLAGQIVKLRTLLYCGSMVLTASVLSMGFWLRWPAAILVGKPQAAMLEWANGMMLYWGGIYSLFLIATYVPAARQLQRRGHQLADVREDKAQVEDEWLLANSLKINLTAQLRLVFAMLGPFLAGPLSSIFS